MDKQLDLVLANEQELALLKPIDDHLAKIQAQIDALRVDGEEKIITLKNKIQLAKENKVLTADEKKTRISQWQKEIEAAKLIEQKNKDQIQSLIREGEDYLAKNYHQNYASKVKVNCNTLSKLAKENYLETLNQLKINHENNLKNINRNDANYRQEIKDENYVYKNKKFDAKMNYQKQLQLYKDRNFETYSHKFHLIDMLRNSRFTFSQKLSQRFNTYKYNFNLRQFLLNNGLYIVIILVFILLCIIAPIIKNTSLFTMTNILNILQQASPRMFLALGVSGLILLTGTDLSIGRIVGMGMVISTVVMHKGINTGSVFGHIFDFTTMPLMVRAILALVLCILFSVLFTSLAGFFTAKYKIHPFISTMSNMLIIFGLVTYGTMGVSFGGIENQITQTIIPRIGSFPTIILWALAAILIIWFVWNKTKLGKYLYAVGGNPEAAAVSGISVFKVTMSAFILAGILYGFGAWLECLRMVGSGSAAYGQGWEMDAIAACVVGGVSFTGGIGKISGVVVGVIIFTALTYSLTTLGIDTNLQFIFEGLIIIAAVTIDSLKYVQKK